MITRYQNNFYPIYDHLLGPTFASVGIALSPFIKDCVTAFILCFLAAYADSAVFDRQFIVFSAFRAVLKFFRRSQENIDESLTREAPYRDYFPSTKGPQQNVAAGMFTKPINFFASLVNWERYSKAQLFFTLVILFQGLVIAVLYTYHQAVSRLFDSLTIWGWLAIGIYMATLYFALSHYSSKKKLTRLDMVIQGIIMLPMLPVGLLGVFLLYIGERLFVVLAMAIIFISILVISPILAWRTTGLSLLLFALIMAFNWGVQHGTFFSALAPQI